LNHSKWLELALNNNLFGEAGLRQLKTSLIKIVKEPARSIEVGIGNG